MKLARFLLLVPLAFSALASSPSFAQTVIIQQAPPPLRYEAEPGARPATPGIAAIGAGMGAATPGCRATGSR
ncbi:hypothetical protein P308_21280 [Pseudomonas piscis]|nr:hypothetical protein P308_21280 [Pseudomonas piscis]